MTNRWTHKVVKMQRGLQGQWFRHAAAATFEALADAQAYADQFRAGQAQAGVVGTKITVQTRGGRIVASYVV